MEMSYGGALVMPKSYAVMDQDEMCYVEGGKVITATGTAKVLKNRAALCMAGWTTLAMGFSYSAASAVSSCIGVGIGVIATIGAAYCWRAVSLYANAFTFFEKKYQNKPKSKTKYYMDTVSCVGLITGVTYGAL